MDRFYYFIIFVNVLLGFKLFWDHRARVKHKRVIDHGLSLSIDMILYSGMSIFLFGVSWIGVAWVFTATMYRGLVFDLLYNLIFNNKWAYCGDSSRVDEFLDELDGKDDQNCIFGVIFKAVMLWAGIMLIILL